MQNPEFKSRQNSFPAEDFSVDVPQLLKLGLVGMLTAGTLAIAAARGEAAALTNWRYDPAARQLEVTVKEGVTPRYFLMAQPARIVLDLPDTEVGEVSVKETYAGAIRQVRVSQFQPGLTRIVMELSTDAVFAPGQVKLEKANKSTWVLRPLIANAPTAEIGRMPPVQTPSQTISRPEGAKAPAPVSALPPPPEIDLPSSFPPVQSKRSTAVVTVPLVKAAAQVEVVQPDSLQPMSPEGSDVSPMNNNLMEGDVSLPAVASRSRPSPSTQSSNSGLATASLPSQAIAQVSPTEKTTPLPPSTTQSAADLLVDLTKAVKLEVPPPVSLPASGSSVVMPASSSVTRKLPAPIQTQPLQIPAIAPVNLSTAMEVSKFGEAIEIPSTLRVATNLPVQVTVPAINASPPTQLAAVPPTITFSAPPQTAMPPLNPPIAAPVVVPMQPPSSVMQTMPRVQPQLPTLQPAALPILQPPSSSVMQSVAPIQLQQPQLQPLQLQQPKMQQPVRAMQPPISSVMQSGPPMLTLPSAVSQPPISSVMQTSVMQTSVMPMPAVSPVSSAPAIAFGVAQPTLSLPQATFSEGAGQSAMVSVPPLQTASPQPQTSAVSVPPLQPMSIPTSATVTPVQMAPIVTSASAATASSTIEFGKSLPIAGATALNTTPAMTNYSATMAPSVTSPLATSMMYQSSVPGLILPTGTMLVLSYPGTVNLSLNAGTPRQEVLILQTEVRDSLGNVVFPRGSYVTGQFDTSREGSRFMAMAISQRDRAIPFAAESDPINGNREVSGSSLAVYSGAGALAGGLVSRFSGLGVLLGGAAGAATNLFTSPKPATIQPGQIIQVRMTREVR